MDDRFNTIAGWALFGGIVALGLSSLSHKYFEADKTHRPHHMGYEIEGVVSSEGGADVEVPIETLLAKADVAKGEQTFKKCTSCHTIEAGGANGIGPNLHGVVSEEIGKGQGGYAFSAALSGHGGNWDWKNLSDWLHNPKKFAPGTKMTFAGLGKAEDRANVIAYLNTQGPNLPLPTAAAGPTAGEGAKAAGATNTVDATAAGAGAQPAPGTAAAPGSDKSTVAAH